MRTVSLRAASQPLTGLTVADQLTTGRINISRIPTNITLPTTVLEGRTAGAIVAGKALTFAWTSGDGPPIATITSGVYQGADDFDRTSGQSAVAGIFLRRRSCPATRLLLRDHVIPLGLAESHHALGDYATAETYCLRAAQYQYLNSVIEAPYVWIRLATLYLDWGDSFFRTGNPQAAVPIYSNVLTAGVESADLSTVHARRPQARF